MSKQNAKNKGRKEPKLRKNVAKSSLEIGEELNIEPRLRAAKTGSVSQNTSRPVKSKNLSGVGVEKEKYEKLPW